MPGRTDESHAGGGSGFPSKHLNIVSLEFDRFDSVKRTE
jgi:hypothetical protein